MPPRRHHRPSVPKPRPARGNEQESSAPPLLFDLDGTLVDSVYAHVIAWREALEQFGIRMPNWKIHRRVGMSGKLFLPTILRELGHQMGPARVKALEKLRGKIFRKKIAGITPLPGAKDLLKFLEQAKVRWALATSGERDQTEKLIRDLAMPESVPIVSGDDITTAKPAPDTFVAAAEKLNVPPADCIVVGDSPWDHLAARRMKALSVGLLCGGYSQSELVEAGACRVYDDPADLLIHIEDLGIQTEA
jgi:beta-phosphoglucomutase-like phosphatase (HAD superfamily)